MQYYLSVDMPVPEIISTDDHSHQINEVAYLIENGKWMVTKGKLKLLINGLNQEFTFLVWAKISTLELSKIPLQNKDFKCSGELMSDVPFYEGGKGCQVNVTFEANRSDYFIPTIEMGSSNNDMYLHQQYGIPRETYLNWMQSLSEGRYPDRK